ncbi:tripartite tricarboxylate transporter substrate-binding protein [Comamonas sp. NLF-1-9]|uniref:tripartite tricarboxylate transporter substrate-binding protein n=1 Tax=Comamonas sp. NLF-1-9 TaxID=2853163 RepID=UPI001C47F0AF|nr:tripartite tricarboxylate transporter substrate-binding protein [Comamonas sp. NLF-1-9]QXL83361.1 tripartite tricarboxylate transporter substrate binding protein [Comamonas sp. NLF-1-9]
MRRRPLIHASALAAFLPLAALSARWPEQPLRWVVPFAPGGTTDFVTRMLAQALAPLLGQSVVVDNVPGRSTVRGVKQVADAPADSYAWLSVTNSLCANETLMRRLPYRLHDLQPVSAMARSEHVLVAYPGSGLKNVADIVAQYESGRALSYASFGAGSSAHLAAELLKTILGTPGIVHQPYSGEAPALAQLLQGKVALMFGTWPQLRSAIAEGRLNALGVASEKRSVFAPQLPTLGEQGASVESASWNGVMAPAGVDEAVVQQMNQAINAVFQMPSVQDVLQAQGLVAIAGSTERFAQFLRSEVKRNADLIYRAGIAFED